MKKLLLFMIGLVLWSTGVFAQNEEMLEHTVVPPKFMGTEDIDVSEPQLSLSNFVNNELSLYNELDEGVVIVLFTVDAKGNLSNLKVEHSTSEYNSAAVKDILMNSKGMWKSGSVNDAPVAMEKEITVKFQNPENGSLEEIARDYMSTGIKKYYKVASIESNAFLSSKKIEKKVNRKLKTAITNLNLAYDYAPRDIGIIFWQCKAYQKIGDEMNFNTKFNEYQSFLNPAYEAMNSDIVFNLKNRR